MISSPLYSPLNLQGSYLAYLRKSRADLEAEANGAGDTLERHRNLLLDLARRLNITIKDVYPEVVSGDSISARPYMQQLLYEVERGMWDGVLVVEVERLARGDTVDQGIVSRAFKYSGTKIITLNKIYDPANEFDEEYFEYGLFMSRREYKTINRRLQLGRMSSVNEGKYIGSIAPFGYAKQKLKQKGLTLVPVPEEAEVVRFIFDRYVNGRTREDGSIERVGMSKIAQEADALGVPPRRSPHWTTSTVSCILANPVYIGKIKWNSRPVVRHSRDGEIVTSRPYNPNLLLTDGLHEPIISEDLWNQAQKLRAESRPIQFPQQKPMQNPFSGLIVCGGCGHTMARRKFQNYPAPYLLCRTPKCSNVSAPFDLVEKRILSAMEKWLDDFKVSISAYTTPEADPAFASKQAALERLGAEIADFQSKKNKIYDLLENGVYSVEEFRERSRNLNNRYEHAVAERDRLESEINKYERSRKNRESLIPKVEHILDIYQETDDPILLNRLLREVVDHIVYTKAEGGGRWRSDQIDSFQIELFMRVPE